MKEKVDYLTVPLWARENSIIPMGPVDRAPFRNSFEDVTLHVYNITSSARLDLYDAGNTVTITAERRGNDIALRLSEPIPDAKVRVNGGAAIEVIGREVVVSAA